SCDTSRPVQARGGPFKSRRRQADSNKISSATTHARFDAHVRNPYFMNLLEDLPVPQRRAVDVVREVAAEKNCEPVLVGGPVRDLLLGRHAIDLDLTLEEGASTI